MDSSLLILLQLLLAHILTDFVLQPGSWVRHKRKHTKFSVYLFLHALIAGLLPYLIIQKWEYWPVFLIIGISHFLIDLWKLQYKKDNLKLFLLDQFFHLLILVLAWLYLTNGFHLVAPMLQKSLHSVSLLAIISSYILVIFPFGFIVGKATQRWQEEIKITQDNNSLEAAGRYIGMFERILVLTFILTSNFSAIGFLIAAKSILRFSEKSESGARKQTEYVLIGTLMSFALTILLGFSVYQFVLQ